MKKTILAAFAGASLLASGAASAIIAGGVDFGTAGDPPGVHIETTTLAETFINGDNQTITGYGQVNTVNGDNTYAVDPDNLLYFVFTDYTSQNFSADSVDFTGGVVNLFLGNLGNLMDQSSAANIAAIQGLMPWATLAGHANQDGNTLAANGELLGASLGFLGAGLLDIVSGIPGVVDLLDVNTIPDGAGGFADIALSTSATNDVLNVNDDTTGCTTGQAQQGQFCFAGSADIRGDTGAPPVDVPEPGALTLLGIGLLSFGLARSKRRKV